MQVINAARKLLSEAVKNFFSLLRRDEFLHPSARKVAIGLYFLILILALVYGYETLASLLIILVVPSLVYVIFYVRYKIINPKIDELIFAIWRLLKLIYFKIVLYAQQINKKK